MVLKHRQVKSLARGMVGFAKSFNEIQEGYRSNRPEILRQIDLIRGGHEDEFRKSDRRLEKHIRSKLAAHYQRQAESDAAILEEEELAKDDSEEEDLAPRYASQLTITSTANDGGDMEGEDDSDEANERKDMETEDDLDGIAGQIKHDPDDDECDENNDNDEFDPHVFDIATFEANLALELTSPDEPRELQPWEAAYASITPNAPFVWPYQIGFLIGGESYAYKTGTWPLEFEPAPRKLQTRTEHNFNLPDCTSNIYTIGTSTSTMPSAPLSEPAFAIPDVSSPCIGLPTPRPSSS